MLNYNEKCMKSYWNDLHIPIFKLIYYFERVILVITHTHKCTDDGMVASTDPRWLQWAFTILVGLFDRVGLKTNQRKTVSMACRPCSATGNCSVISYTTLFRSGVGVWTLHGRQAMLTVLRWFVFSPTRSKRPTRIVKASVDATIPSSVHLCVCVMTKMTLSK